MERSFLPLKWKDRGEHHISIPNKESISITIEREVVEKVDEIAEGYGMSRSEVVENLVKKALGKSSIFSAPKLLEEIKEEKEEEENVIEESDWLEIREKVIETEQRR